MNRPHESTTPHLLQGIIPPLVTPLKARDAIDHDGLQRLVEHVLAGGVSGLFVLGTTGEAPSLGYRVRSEMVERVAELVGGRVPLLVGITDTSLAESLELAERAADAGSTAVVAAPPAYYPIDQAELTHHFERLAAELPLPLVLYNMPGCTKVGFEPETVLRLSRLPNVLGLKDSSGDLGYLRRLHELLPDRDRFRLMVGPEEQLAAAVAVGADGGVNGGANMFPRLYVELYAAARAGKTDRIRQLHQAVMLVSQSIYSLGNQASRVIRGIKAALAHLGICSDFVVEPFREILPAERRRIAAAVDRVQETISENLAGQIDDTPRGAVAR